MKNRSTPGVACALLIVAALTLSGAAGAQNYPARPVKLVVGFPPGGGVDINARLLASKLSEYMGQQVIVDNRPGAGTNIANEYVARATPDGYTLLMNTAAVAINMSLYKKPGFDTLRDFAAVSVFSASPNILVVNAATKATNVAELIAEARGSPGTLNYASAGSGTTQHLSGELFKTLTRTDIVHIPYKGTAPALAALISGEVQLSFANIPAIQSHVKSGRLRPLANTGLTRAQLMPDVPTLKEAGVDMNVVVWYGVLAPAATPKEIVTKLGEMVRRAAHAPDLHRRLLDQGAEPIGSSPEEFGRQLRAEVASWAAVVKASGASVND